MMKFIKFWTVIPAECREGRLTTSVSSTHANNHTQTLDSGSAKSASSPDKWPGGVRRAGSGKEKHSRPHQHHDHHTLPLNSHDQDQSLNVPVNENLNNKKCGVIYGFKQRLIFPFSFTFSFSPLSSTTNQDSKSEYCFHISQSEILPPRPYRVPLSVMNMLTFIVR